MIGLVAAGGCGGSSDGADRQEIVAERGREVMGFDLDRTTHRFTPMSSGGTQTVVSDDGDVAQVDAVRRHLRAEAERFAAGDFADPEQIHGSAMPGLDMLEARSDEFDVRYLDVPDGGRIIYRAADAHLVEALHEWFDAQIDDHGTHADGGQS